MTSVGSAEKVKMKLSLESQLNVEGPRVPRTARKSIRSRCKTGVSNKRVPKHVQIDVRRLHWQARHARREAQGGPGDGRHGGGGGVGEGGGWP